MGKAEDNANADMALMELLDTNVKEVLVAAQQLSPAELTRLQELEGEGGNRTGVVNGISALIEKQQNGSDDPPDGGKADRGEEIPDWQKPDYNGSLTVPQAAWRNEHLTAKRIEQDIKTK